MGKSTDKPSKNSNSGAAKPGFTVTGRNMDGRKTYSRPVNRGEGGQQKS